MDGLWLGLGSLAGANTLGMVFMMAILRKDATGFLLHLILASGCLTLSLVCFHLAGVL